MSYDIDTEYAVRVNNLSKSYKIFKNPGNRLAYHLFKTNGGKDFWALQDISFEIKKGESFGIIGKNGSGKSTMLQILANIIRPTEGNMQINGRIAALLELGSGFNPESTGYENIYMNAAILGVEKDEIEEKISGIIEFADIGDFIKQPVKTYSSGMYIRLAFAIAINVDADIILIDEALAVGDVFFRQKCYSKLNELKKEGKTIILVSHSMNEVEEFCDRAILLSKGKNIVLGNSRDVVKEYYMLDQKEICQAAVTNNVINDNELQINKVENKIKFNDWERKEDIFFDLNDSKETANDKTRILKVGLFDKDGFSKRSFLLGEYAYFYYEIMINENINLPLIGTLIFDHRNILVHGKDNMQMYMNLPDSINNGSIVYVLQRIKLDINIGEYTFDTGIATISRSDYEMRSYKNQEAVNETMERLSSRTQIGYFTVKAKQIGEPMKYMFHGCTDLSGDIQLKVGK